MTYNNSLTADESYRGQQDPTFRYSKVTSRMGQAPERYRYDFNPEDTKQYSRQWVGSGKSNTQTFDSEDAAYNAYQNGDYDVPVFAMMGDNGQLQYYRVDSPLTPRRPAETPAPAEPTTIPAQRPVRKPVQTPPTQPARSIPQFFDDGTQYQAGLPRESVRVSNTWVDNNYQPIPMSREGSKLNYIKYFTNGL